jgi:hypothetical protein
MLKKQLFRYLFDHHQTDYRLSGFDLLVDFLPDHFLSQFINQLKKEFIMKKLTVLITVAAFLSAGALFHSCKKDEMKDPVKTIENPVLKVLSSDFGLPIFMGKTTPVGDAEITFNCITNEISVAINLDVLPEGWVVTEAHLYAGLNPPPSSAPGQFPFHWHSEDGPLGFTIPGPDPFVCPGFTWHYALHLALRMQTGIDPITLEPIYTYETAWLLPEQGGTNWLNKKGKPIGWGEYFQWMFDYEPDITQIELFTTTDLEGQWTAVSSSQENSFEMCLDPLIPWYYFDTDMDADPALAVNLNPFYLTGSYPPEFYDYWALRGVFEGCSDTWGEPYMWEIIKPSGERAPMFYVKWDGSQYDLIDGLQYAVSGGTVENPLRINGGYFPWEYLFTGYLEGACCTSALISISLDLVCLP